MNSKKNKEQVGKDFVEAASAMLSSAPETLGGVVNAWKYRQEKLDKLKDKLERQAKKYKKRLAKRMEFGMDTFMLSSEQLINYLNDPKNIPEEILHAYQLAYPQLAPTTSFADQVASLSSDELSGFMSGIKGKLFELKYVDYLNDGHLPDHYTARLAQSATQPGWDIAVQGPDHHIASLIQAKATDSVAYVNEALQRYPDIHVVTTEEVYAKLMMHEAAEHAGQLTNSGISEDELMQSVGQAVEHPHIHMHWSPPLASFALIAFTSYNRSDLDRYEKARLAGSRFGKSYLAALIGSGIGVLTQTWWLGVLSGIGIRYLANKGNLQREQYERLKALKKINKKILAELKLNS